MENIRFGIRIRVVIKQKSFYGQSGRTSIRFHTISIKSAEHRRNVFEDLKEYWEFLTVLIKFVSGK